MLDVSRARDRMVDVQIARRGVRDPHVLRCHAPRATRNEARGPQSKAVVWAHNSHIGDARYTEMGVVREELNIGQLCRERFGGDAALIGFGTHRGTVAAAAEWGGDMDVKHLRPSHRDSYERLCHDAGIPRSCSISAVTGRSAGVCRSLDWSGSSA